jgi:hypothetical protein
MPGNSRDLLAPLSSTRSDLAATCRRCDEKPMFVAAQVPEWKERLRRRSESRGCQALFRLRERADSRLGASSDGR